MRARTVSAVRPSPPRLGVRVRAVLSTRQRGVECSHLDCADGPAGSGLVIAVQGPGGIAFPANGARLAAAGLRRPGAQPDSCALSCAVRSCQACRSAGPRFRQSKVGHNLELPFWRMAEAFRLVQNFAFAALSLRLRKRPCDRKGSAQWTPSIISPKTTRTNIKNCAGWLGPGMLTSRCTDARPRAGESFQPCMKVRRSRFCAARPAPVCPCCGLPLGPGLQLRCRGSADDFSGSMPSGLFWHAELVFRSLPALSGGFFSRPPRTRS